MKPTYTIISAPDFCDRGTYARATSMLLRRAYEQDPTVIPHIFEEMLDKYEGSVLAILGNQIVGQASIYKSSIPKYDLSYEVGSVIVDKNHSNNSLGSQIMNSLIRDKRSHYHGIISATVNPRMYPIFEKNGFFQVDFPPQYLLEGEQYLAPQMLGGIKEFHQKARCYFRKGPHSQFDEQ